MITCYLIAVVWRRVLVSEFQSHVRVVARARFILVNIILCDYECFTRRIVTHTSLRFRVCVIVCSVIACTVIVCTVKDTSVCMCARAPHVHNIMFTSPWRKDTFLRVRTRTAELVTLSLIYGQNKNDKIYHSLVYIFVSQHVFWTVTCVRVCWLIVDTTYYNGYVLAQVFGTLCTTSRIGMHSYL